MTSVTFTDYSFGDGGTFNGAPQLQYITEPGGAWVTAAVTWSTLYDSSYSAGRKNTYLITPDAPLVKVWGIRLNGDTTPSPGAWDHTGWASVTELKVSGSPDFGRSINFSSNIAAAGTPICSNSAWKTGVGAEIIDGNFDNSNEIWDTGTPAGEKFVGIQWGSPQNNVAAVGFAMTFKADGGWFIDTVDDPLKVEYTVNGTDWIAVTNLKKGRYTEDYQSAAALAHDYKGAWLFSFDSVSNIVGLRLVGMPDGSVAELSGNGYVSIREFQVFKY